MMAFMRPLHDRVEPERIETVGWRSGCQPGRIIAADRTAQ
jgi:hypothetical protein